MGRPNEVWLKVVDNPIELTKCKFFAFFQLLDAGMNVLAEWNRDSSETENAADLIPHEKEA